MPRGDSLDSDPIGGMADLTQLYASILYTMNMGLRIIMPAEVVEYAAPVPGASPALVKVRVHFESLREIDNPAELTASETLVTQADRLLARKQIADIPNCPVLYLGHAGMRMSGPLEVGEVGLYLVCDRSLDAWINEGGPLDPSFSQLHDISDGVFIPGLRSGNIAQDIPGDVDRVGREDGTAGMSINRETKDIVLETDGPSTTLDAATEILLGAAATLGVARLTDTTSADTTMATWLVQAQVVLAGAAALLMLPVPVPPTDFGVITSASSKTKSE